MLKMKGYIRIVAVCMLLSATGSVSAQVLDSLHKGKVNKFGGDVQKFPKPTDTDSIETVYFPDVIILELRHFTKKRDQKKYDRLVRNVKKAYPIAKEAGRLYDHYDSLTEDKSGYARRQTMKNVESELWDNESDKIKKLTPEQGRILLRLIDRETGFTSYEIAQQWRGKFNAFMYQTAASLFNFNLKSKFNPKTSEEDLYIEEIIALIELGKI